MFLSTCSTSISLCRFIYTAASQYHRNNLHVIVPVIPFSLNLLKMTHYNATKHCIDTYGYDARLLNFDNGFEVETLSSVLRKLKLGVNVLEDTLFWSRLSDLFSIESHYAFQIKSNNLKRRVIKPNSEKFAFACLASKYDTTLQH